MYLALKKNWDKVKHLILTGFAIIFLLLLAVVYKNDDKITKKSELIKSPNETTDLKIFKEFILNQINSPFLNLNYEIKKGDTIQKILKKYKVKNNDIQTTINQYKKYGNPNQLLVGNKIDDLVGQKKPLSKVLMMKKKLYEEENYYQNMLLLNSQLT